MKHIVIIGAGVAGVTAALGLQKIYKNNPEVFITIINREPYFLFLPNLYEIASSPEELTDLASLEATITISLKEIFGSTKVKVVVGTVTEVDKKNKVVIVENKKITYDILVQAMGSDTNYFNIPGAEKHAIGLKTVGDALRIRNKIEFLIASHRQDVTKDFIRIVVAGGGVLGAEIAAEMSGYLDFLSWKYNYPRHKLQTFIIEGTSRILPGFSERSAQDIAARLSVMQVVVQTNRFIQSVDEYFITYKNGEKFSYDCLIWSAGVKAHVLEGNTLLTDRLGRIVTREYLQADGDPHVLYIGDQASVQNKVGAVMPATIPSAEAQAEYVVHAVSALLQNKKPKSFNPPVQPGYFVTGGGHWAILDSRYVYLKGFSAYLIRAGVYVRFFSKLIGWPAGLRLFLKQYRIYGYNDKL